jgi:hypothetical protein
MAAGLSAGPGLPVNERSARVLLALAPGDVLRLDNPDVAASVEDAARRIADLSPELVAALGQQLLRRGDPRVWEVVDGLPALDGPDTTGRAQTVWLVRDMLLYDQFDLLMVAPAWALRPLEEGAVIEVELAPTRFGPVSYRLERQGAELVMEWSGLSRTEPRHLIWPLPEAVRRIEPPVAVLTDSRKALRLPPEGGTFRVLPVGW